MKKSNILEKNFNKEFERLIIDMLGDYHISENYFHTHTAEFLVHSSGWKNSKERYDTFYKEGKPLFRIHSKKEGKNLYSMEATKYDSEKDG